MKRSDEIKRDLTRRKDSATSLWLSTGSTMLNLACSGRPDGGFLAGHYYLLVGDSDSGKTFLSLTCLAEASINPAFDDYRFIYDGTEGGALMDVERFFGPGVARRMEPPASEKDGSPWYSSTVEEFYYHVDDALNLGRPFIYVLDSQDCLSSRAEVTKFDESKEAYRKGKDKDLAGSYGDSKAKCHSANLRKLMGPLERSGSILLVVNQTRDSFDPFEKTTYSGGRALMFYATLQLWSTRAGNVKRTVRGKDRQLGIYSKVRVKKNRVTGRDRTVTVPILHSSGIDDLGGIVDYLVAEGVWEKDGAKIEVRGLGPAWSAGREAIVCRVQEEGMEDDLRCLAAETWNSVEEACRSERRSRYDNRSGHTHDGG